MELGCEGDLVTVPFTLDEMLAFLSYFCLLKCLFLLLIYFGLTILTFCFCIQSLRSSMCASVHLLKVLWQHHLLNINLPPKQQFACRVCYKVRCTV